MNFDLKRKLAVGTSALAAVAFAGGAYAATQGSATSGRQAFLDDVAKRLNVTPKNLTAALRGALVDRLAAAVAAGNLTQAQANQIEQQVRQGAAAPLGAFLDPGRFGGGQFSVPGDRGGPEGPGDPGGPPGPLGGGLGGAAAYLGLSPSELSTQLDSGKSLAQVAGARGKSVSGLKDAIATAARTRLAEALAAKRITSAQERQILGRLSADLDALLRRSVPGAGDRPRWGMPGSRPGRPGYGPPEGWPPASSGQSGLPGPGPSPGY